MQVKTNSTFAEKNKKKKWKIIGNYKFQRRGPVARPRPRPRPPLTAPRPRPLPRAKEKKKEKINRETQ